MKISLKDSNQLFYNCESSTTTGRDTSNQKGGSRQLAFEMKANKQDRIIIFYTAALQVIVSEWEHISLFLR